MEKQLNVVIGRFQPVHKNHILDVIAPALAGKQNETLILIGSSNRSRTPKNPFLYSERVELLKIAIKEYSENSGVEIANYNFMPLNDFVYSDEDWKNQVIQKVEAYKSAIETYKNETYRVCLYGSEKDQSSYYLRMFPQWEFISGRVTDRTFGATKVRELIYLQNEDWKEMLSPRVSEKVEDWISSEEGKWVIREANFYEESRKKREEIKRVSGYEPVFLAVDAICFHRDSVLLIKRNHQPGKGLYSLPGGYIHSNKDPFSSCASRCKEETGVKPLQEWLFHEKVYANPNRSENGRICTIGFAFNIPRSTGENGGLDHILMLDSLEDNAIWLPIDRLEELSEQLFEDHYDIIMNAKSKR